MSTYSRMQLLKLVESQQMSPEEALKIIRENSQRPAGQPQHQPQPPIQEEPLIAAPADRQDLGSQLNKLLVEGVATLLKVPAGKIHPDADWKSFGFDSISFTAFHSYLTEKLGFSFPLDVFFEYSTINTLTGFLLTQSSGAEVSFSGEPAVHPTGHLLSQSPAETGKFTPARQDSCGWSTVRIPFSRLLEQACRFLHQCSRDELPSAVHS